MEDDELSLLLREGEDQWFAAGEGNDHDKLVDTLLYRIRGELARPIKDNVGVLGGGGGGGGEVVFPLIPGHLYLSLEQRFRALAWCHLMEEQCEAALPEALEELLRRLKATLPPIPLASPSSTSGRIFLMFANCWVSLLEGDLHERYMGNLRFDLQPAQKVRCVRSADPGTDGKPSRFLPHLNMRLEQVGPYWDLSPPVASFGGDKGTNVWDRLPLLLSGERGPFLLLIVVGVPSRYRRALVRALLSPLELKEEEEPGMSNDNNRGGGELTRGLWGQGDGSSSGSSGGGPLYQWIDAGKRYRRVVRALAKCRQRHTILTTDNLEAFLLKDKGVPGMLLPQDEVVLLMEDWEVVSLIEWFHWNHIALLLNWARRRPKILLQMQSVLYANETLSPFLFVQ